MVASIIFLVIIQAGGLCIVIHYITHSSNRIESMSTNSYAFYRFAIHLIVYMLNLTVRLSFSQHASTHSFSVHRHSLLLFLLYKLDICLSRFPSAFNRRKPYRYDGPRVWIVYTMLVFIDICGFERYNCEWQWWIYWDSMPQSHVNVLVLMLCLNIDPQKSVHSIYIKFSAETFGLLNNKPNELMSENGAKRYKNLPFLCSSIVFAFLFHSHKLWAVY